MAGIKTQIEQGIFNFSYWFLGLFGVKYSKIRLLFIYISFLAISSPFVAIAITISWFFDLKKYFRRQHIWDF